MYMYKMYKEAHQLCSNYKGSTIRLPLYTKCQASSLLLLLYRQVCVTPGRKPRRLYFSRRGSLTLINNLINTTRKSSPAFHFLIFVTKLSLLVTQYEPPLEKTNNVVFEQVRLKPGCTATEES